MLQERTIGNVALPVMRPVLVQQPMGHTAYSHVGGIADETMKLAYPAMVGFSIYHGYGRGKAKGAIIWGLLAALFPIPTAAVAGYQHLHKRKGK